jgi:hypothetical protein
LGAEIVRKCPARKLVWLVALLCSAAPLGNFKKKNIKKKKRAARKQNTFCVIFVLLKKYHLVQSAHQRIVATSEA